MSARLPLHAAVTRSIRIMPDIQSDWLPAQALPVRAPPDFSLIGEPIRAGLLAQVDVCPG